MSDYKKHTDECLMMLIVEGNHDAFSVLVHRHSSRFFRTAFRYCSNAEEAEDIVQDAFIKLWTRREKWNPKKQAKFTTWFYRVVTNQALDHLRRKKPETMKIDLSLFVDGKETQDIKLIMSEEQRALECAIQNLPERQQTALNLCFYDGLSNKDAAYIMNIGVKAVESLLMRAKKNLKDHMFRHNIIEREKQYG